MPDAGLHSEQEKHDQRSCGIYELVNLHKNGPVLFAIGAQESNTETQIWEEVRL